MDIYNSYATDTVSESEGRWVKLDKETSVLVARTGNPNYLKSLRQRMKDAQIDVEDQSEANEKLVADLINDTLAETILLGWKGKFQYKGADLPYTVANARMLLEIKDFRKRITDVADKAESFRVKDEAEQKNA
jgi:hypothetical protein